MKILQLNVWMGKVEGELERLLKNNPYDVICMQEVMASSDAEVHLSRMCVDLSRILQASEMPYFAFAPNWRSKIGNGHFFLGNLILSRIPIVETSHQFVHGKFHRNLILDGIPENNLNIMSAKLENGLTVVNHHGFWRPNPIGDADTVKAFHQAAEFVKKFDDPLVMCGDLNISHESPAMRELDFLRDLTHEYKIKNTLSGLKFNGKVACDHILINNLVQATSCRTLDSLASDHLPLEAEITF